MYMHECCTGSVTVDRTPAFTPEVRLMHPPVSQEVGSSMLLTLSSLQSALHKETTIASFSRNF